MIAEKDTDREVVGALTGVTHQMGIAADATAHIMDILSKGLYERPKEAILREYSTNARDAHVEAGCPTRPIEVVLPTAFRPILSIRDFGTGLDEEEIGSIYSQYGASTKRSSNEFNGMLGLGCKSAFSYGNRFVVVSIKAGIRIEVAVTREEDGTGGMIVVDKRATDEPSGTLVQIPTKARDDFKAEAQRIFQWWPASMITLKAGAFKVKHFDPSADGVLKIADGFYIVKIERDLSRYDRSEHDDQIIMGGVAYPYRFETGLNRQTHHLVIFAPMGAVNFAPSREGLVQNGVTKRFIADKTEQFTKALVKTMQDKIDAAPTAADAVRVVARWREVVPTTARPQAGYTWRGKVIPQKVNLPTDPQGRPTDRMVQVPLQRRGYHNGHDRYTALPLERMVDVLFVEGYTVEKFTGPHAQKLRKYAEDKKLDIPNGFILVGAIPSDIRPWLENIATWNDIRQVKLPRDQPVASRNGTMRIPGSYDLWTTSSQPGLGKERYSGIPAETFKSWPEPLFYATGNAHSMAYYWEALKAIHPRATLVCMRGDRVAKFKRNFPKAEQALPAIRSGYAVWAGGLAGDPLIALAIKADYGMRNLSEYDASKVDDPGLKRYIELAGQDHSKVDQQNRVFRSVLGRAVTLPKLTDYNRKYPLMSPSHKSHTYMYVNAVYAAAQTKGVTP